MQQPNPPPPQPQEVYNYQLNLNKYREQALNQPEQMENGKTIMKLDQEI